jgi:hypothetical protein
MKQQQQTTTTTIPTQERAVKTHTSCLWCELSLWERNEA